MAKIKSLEELQKIRKASEANTQIRLTGDNPDRVVVRIGLATCGIAAGAREVMTAMLDEIQKNGLNDVSVVGTGCLGYCYAEPLVEVVKPGVEPIRYGYVDAARGREIIQKHIMHGELLDNAIIGREVPRA